MTTPTHAVPAAGTAPPMTPERWRAVDAILQAALACDPDRRDAMGKAGRILTEKQFSWRAIVERWLGEVGYVGNGARTRAA